MVGSPSVDWLGVPLKKQGQAFGVLVVQSYDPAVRFAEADKDMLTFVSHQIAAALERKRAEARIEHLAYHDLAHRPSQPPAPARPARPGGGPGPARQDPDRRPLPRPRPLQGHQRLPRPHRGRRGAAGRWPDASRTTCARATPSPASAATSSRPSSATCTTRWTRPRSRRSCRARCGSRSWRAGASCSSPPPSASASIPTTGRTWRPCSRTRTRRCIAPRSTGSTPSASSPRP